MPRELSWFRSVRGTLMTNKCFGVFVLAFFHAAISPRQHTSLAFQLIMNDYHNLSVDFVYTQFAIMALPALNRQCEMAWNGMEMKRKNNCGRHRTMSLNAKCVLKNNTFSFFSAIRFVFTSDTHTHTHTIRFWFWFAGTIRWRMVSWRKRGDWGNKHDHFISIVIRYRQFLRKPLCDDSMQNI